MKTFNSEFIVLKRINYGECDRILHVLTPEYGKIPVMAKGSRKITSRRGVNTELFAYSRGHFARGRTFAILTQATLLDDFSTLREQFERINTVCYLLELCAAVAQEGQESSDLFSLLTTTLSHAHSFAQTSPATTVLPFFESNLLALLGMKPELGQCSVCRHPHHEQISVFQITPQGIICADCAARYGKEHAFTISATQLTQLQTLQVISWEDYLPISHLFTSVSRILRTFLHDAIGRTLITTPMEGVSMGA